MPSVRWDWAQGPSQPPPNPACREEGGLEHQPGKDTALPGGSLFPGHALVFPQKSERKGGAEPRLGSSLQSFLICKRKGRGLTAPQSAYKPCRPPRHGAVR